MESKDPLHGMTLEKIINFLVDYYGWEELSMHVDIRCFYSDPSVKSSLKFLRKTAWARKKVEKLYINTLEFEERMSNRKNSVEDVKTEMDSSEEASELK